MTRLIYILFAMILLCACGHSTESKAKAQMVKTIKDLAKDPDVKVSNIKTVFDNDTLVIMQCVVRGLNGFGGYTRSEMEYVYLYDHKDKKAKEALLDMDKSVIKQASEAYKESLEMNPANADSITHIVMSAVINLAFRGRDVEE